MSGRRFAHTENAEVLPLGDVPVVAIAVFRETVIDTVRDGARLVALFGTPQLDGRLLVFAVLAMPDGGPLAIVAMAVEGSYPALTGECPQAHMFERELAEQWGVVPEGHPWLKPIRFHRSWQPARDAWGRDPDQDPRPGVTDFYSVEGEEIHEVAVGPVHAGVIEPGHFRFQCHGEIVHHLEIALGYQHRGIERALVGGPDKRTMPFMETAAGDTSIGHGLAYCQAMEALGHGSVPPRAMALRGVALELERIANHVGDLGALAGDVGFLPTASYCGRIRGDVLNLTAILCGSRFGRGFVRAGGVAFDVTAAMIAEVQDRLAAAARDAAEAIGLMWDTPSVTARFEDTGTVSRETCVQVGMVGPAARACGVDQDVRKDAPFGIYRFALIPTVTWDTGDVFGRAHVREIEILRSVAFIREQLENLPQGGTCAAVAPPAPESLVVSLVEGWRGEICHVVLTDAAGRFARYKIVDPSFHNWFGLALAMRGEPISDFPLCNKSFNLSYCGHDL
jgi:Ni,Fe-hydrogenase III large subunit